MEPFEAAQSFASCRHGQPYGFVCAWCVSSGLGTPIKEDKSMDGQQLKTGEKKDEGKPRIELLPFDVLEAIARILTIGALKYDSRNWEQGIEYGRIFGAAQRHLIKFWNAHINGSDGINSEDGRESHLDHAITELMFLSAYEKRNMKQFDNRPGK